MIGHACPDSISIYLCVDLSAFQSSYRAASFGIVELGKRVRGHSESYDAGANADVLEAPLRPFGPPATGHYFGNYLRLLIQAKCFTTV